MHSAYPHMNVLFHVEKPDAPKTKAMIASAEYRAHFAALETASAIATAHKDPQHDAYKKALTVVDATRDVLHRSAQWKAYEAMLNHEGIPRRPFVSEDVPA